MEEALANLVALTLRHANFATRAAPDVAQARLLVSSWDPHALIVDLDHHDRGLELGREKGDGQDGPFGNDRLPVLGITRKRDALMKLSAFERGAADVIEVPFTADEIVVRTMARVKRAHRMAVELQPTIRDGRLELDLVRQRVRVDGGDLKLTPIEQTLLYLLASNPERTLSRDLILSCIWGPEPPVGSNVIDRHIRDLRVKLNDHWRQPRYIETVAGKGYRFVNEEPQPRAGAAGS